MMKILLINKFYFLKGGAEKHFFDQKELLKKKGHQVIVFAMQHKNNLPSKYEKYFVSQVDFENVKFNSEGLRTAGRMLYSFEAVRKLEQLIINEKPDIAHIHNIYHQISPSILFVLRKYSIPTFQTLHDYKIICPNYSLFTQGKVCERCRGYNYWECISHRCIKNSLPASILTCFEMYFHKLFKFYEDRIDVFFSPSLFFIKKMRDWKTPIVEIRHLPNFIAVDAEPDFNIGDYILYLGRLSPEKGLITFLNAVKDIHFPVKIVGTGPQAEILKNKIKHENISQIEFLGFKQGEELKAIIRHARCLILPSELYENFPMAIMEAYACGKPAIGSDLGGIPELIENGKTGYLFRAGSSEDLNKKINRLIEQPELAKKMGENGYSFVKKYSPDSYYQILINIYEKVAEQKKKLR